MDLATWLATNSERDTAVSSARHCLALAHDRSLRSGFRRAMLAQAATYRRIAMKAGQ
jgi:hypothetical protein